MYNTINLEVCANSFASALAAEKGGAIRVELCENMAEGGTTASYAQIKLAKEHLKLAVWPIIRPRGGDFLYSDYEFEIMKTDISCCKALKCDGVVTGILTADGEIDKKRCDELIKLASPMPVAFHRAFDQCKDLSVSLETLIDLGFVRVLTSGAALDAHQGMETLAALVKQANSRIEIMPGGGISPMNIIEIKKATGADVFHASARVKIQSKMTYQKHDAKLVSTIDEYEVEQTSEALVKLIVNANG
jgi:copper homeostasis protein